MERKTKYFIFNYSKNDEDLIIELDNYLNQKKEDIFNFFDCVIPDNQVIINIIPTKKEYDELAKKIRGVDNVAKWSIGFFHDNNIEYVSLHDYKNTAHAFSEDRYYEKLDYYKKTIVHEYVHYVAALYRKKHNVEYSIKYLNEGIATYLSGQKENVEIPFNFKIEDILESNNSYDSWYLITKYIIEEYGKNYFFKLFDNPELAFKEADHLLEEARDYYKKKTLK